MKNTGLYRVLNSVFEAYNAEGWSDGETNTDDSSLTASLSKNLSKKMVGGSLVFDFEGNPKNIPDIWTKNIPSFLYWLNGPDGQKYWSSFYKYMSQSTSLKWSSNWYKLMNNYNGKYFSESSSLRIMWSNFEWFMIFLYTTFFIPRGVRFTKTYIINALKDGFGDGFNMLYFDNRVRTLGDIEYLLHGDGVKVKDVSEHLTATSQGVLYQLVLGLTEDIYKHLTGDTYNSRLYSPNHNFIHQVIDWLEDMSGIIGPDFLKLIDMDDVPESDNYYVSNCISDTTNNLMQWARQAFPE